jgi:hypothetical protein
VPLVRRLGGSRVALWPRQRVTEQAVIKLAAEQGGRRQWNLSVLREAAVANWKSCWAIHG